MTTKVVNGIEYRQSTSGQWIAQRFEVQRFSHDHWISSLTGGQALAIIFSGGISKGYLIQGIQTKLPLDK